MAKRKPHTYGVSISPHKGIVDIISVTWKHGGVVLHTDLNLRGLPVGSGNQRGAIHHHVAPLIRQAWFAADVEPDGWAFSERVVAEITGQIASLIAAREAAGDPVRGGYGIGVQFGVAAEAVPA